MPEDEISDHCSSVESTNYQNNDMKISVQEIFNDIKTKSKNVNNSRSLDGTLRFMRNSYGRDTTNICSLFLQDVTGKIRIKCLDVRSDMIDQRVIIKNWTLACEKGKIEYEIVGRCNDNHNHNHNDRSLSYIEHLYLEISINSIVVLPSEIVEVEKVLRITKIKDMDLSQVHEKSTECMCVQGVVLAVTPPIPVPKPFFIVHLIQCVNEMEYTTNIYFPEEFLKFYPTIRCGNEYIFNYLKWKKLKIAKPAPEKTLNVLMAGKYNVDGIEFSTTVRQLGIPQSLEIFNCNNNNNRTIIYDGEITKILKSTLYEIDSSLRLFLDLYPCPDLAAGLRVGARVRLWNVHPIYLWNRLEGFGACLYSNIEILSFSSRSQINSIYMPLRCKNTRLYSADCLTYTAWVVRFKKAMDLKFGLRSLSDRKRIRSKDQETLEAWLKVLSKPKLVHEPSRTNGIKETKRNWQFKRDIISECLLHQDGGCCVTIGSEGLDATKLPQLPTLKEIANKIDRNFKQKCESIFCQRETIRDQIGQIFIFKQNEICRATTLLGEFERLESLEKEFSCTPCFKFFDQTNAFSSFIVLKNNQGQLKLVKDQELTPWTILLEKLFIEETDSRRNLFSIESSKICCEVVNISVIKSNKKDRVSCGTRSIEILHRQNRYVIEYKTYFVINLDHISTLYHDKDHINICKPIQLEKGNVNIYKPIQIEKAASVVECLALDNNDPTKSESSISFCALIVDKGVTESTTKIRSGHIITQKCTKIICKGIGEAKTFKIYVSHLSIEDEWPLALIPGTIIFCNDFKRYKTTNNNGLYIKTYNKSKISILGFHDTFEKNSCIFESSFKDLKKNNIIFPSVQLSSLLVEQETMEGIKSIQCDILHLFSVKVKPKCNKCNENLIIRNRQRECIRSCPLDERGFIWTTTLKVDDGTGQATIVANGDLAIRILGLQREKKEFIEKKILHCEKLGNGDLRERINEAVVRVNYEYLYGKDLSSLYRPLKILCKKNSSQKHQPKAIELGNVLMETSSLPKLSLDCLDIEEVDNNTNLCELYGVLNSILI